MRTTNGSLQLFKTVTLVIGLSASPFFALAGQPATVPLAVVSNTKSSGYNLEVVDGELLLAGNKIEATLGNVVDALRDQYPEANIVLAPNLGKLKVADLKLRAGHLLDELEGLRVATGGKFDIKSPSVAASTIDPTTGLPREGAKPNAGMFVLNELPPIGPGQKIVEAFNIGPYLDWVKRYQPMEVPKRESEDHALNELLRMIQDTITDFNGNAGDAERPRCQYHPGATLLVVIGRIDSVEIARKIVNALPGMSAVADNARARYGLGAQTPEQRAAEEAFRARYGLLRVTPPSNQEANPQQESDEDTNRANAEAAFRKRYGLGPAPNRASQPANPQQAPDTPK